MLLDDYTPMSQYYAEKIGELGTKFNNEQSKRLSTTANSGAILMGDDGGDCGSCESGCQNCEGGCSGTCATACTAKCAGGCDGTCTSSCTNSCSADCKGDCKSGCSGSCKGECSGTCESACQVCQTYCEVEQLYVKNIGSSFSWSVTPTQKQKISISASEWDTLANYVQSAAPYCHSDTKLKSLTIGLRPEKNSPISAATFNELVEGLGYLDISPSTTLPGKKYGLADKATHTPDVIKAADFKALASRYNEAYINTSHECCQIEETPKSQFGSNQPCKNGQSCISNGEQGEQL